MKKYRIKNKEYVNPLYLTALKETLSVPVYKGILSCKTEDNALLLFTDNVSIIETIKMAFVGFEITEL